MKALMVALKLVLVTTTSSRAGGYSGSMEYPTGFLSRKQFQQFAPLTRSDK